MARCQDLSDCIMRAEGPLDGKLVDMLNHVMTSSGNHAEGSWAHRASVLAELTTQSLEAGRHLASAYQYGDRQLPIYNPVVKLMNYVELTNS